MSSRVFVPQETQRKDRASGLWKPVLDLSPAAEHGAVITMLAPSPFIADYVGMVSELTAILLGYYDGWDGQPGEPEALPFNDNDFLLPVGSPTAIAASAAIAAKINDGRVKMLVWSGTHYIVPTLDLFADPIFDD
jgi:hypothetical protein